MTNQIRKCIIIANTVLALTLCGCGDDGGRAAFDELRARIENSERVEMTALVTCDTGDAVGEYTLSALREGGETVVEVQKPEIIAGVRAILKDGEDSLSYDGVSLSLGQLTESGLTPVSVLPALVDALAHGHVERIWREDGNIAVTLIPSDEISITAVIDSGTHLPLEAEITRSSDGRVVSACRTTSISVG